MARKNGTPEENGRRPDARLTPPQPNVKGKGSKQPGYAALAIRSHRRYIAAKAAADKPLPPRHKSALFYTSV